MSRWEKKSYKGNEPLRLRWGGSNGARREHWSPGISQSEGYESRLEGPPRSNRFRPWVLQMRKLSPSEKSRRQDGGFSPEPLPPGPDLSAHLACAPPNSKLTPLCLASPGARPGCPNWHPRCHPATNLRVTLRQNDPPLVLSSSPAE